MIKLDPYEKTFEKEYWDTVKKKISQQDQKEIVESCRKFLPPAFFSGNDCFQELVLAPYEKLKEAQKYIKDCTWNIMQKECFEKNPSGKKVMKHPFQVIYDAFEMVAKTQKGGESMRVRMVRALGLTVCPYCNRDYINSRKDNISGAQLDHFYSRKVYPFFSVSLYNLIPVCGNCNRVKSARNIEFASPFDQTIHWDEDVVFSYQPEMFDSVKVTINAKGSVKNNIDRMGIRKAYEIHDIEVKELLEKQQFYGVTQREEFAEVLKGMNLSEQDIKRSVFGSEITTEAMKTRPLGRMMRDLHRELGVYG